jgi:hypothetical protein
MPLSTSQMVPGLKPSSFRDRGGRLQAFARGQSDAQARYNAPSSKHEVPVKRSATPTNVVALVPTRTEIADDARVPIPTSTRVESTRSVPPVPFSQPLHFPLPVKTPDDSPKKVEPASSPKDLITAPQVKEESGGQRELFEGSQLGEGFMDSGITTPQNEVEDVEVNAYDDEKHLALQAATDRRRSRSTRAVGQRGFTHFQVGEDGYMTVIAGGERRSPSQMRDGFENGPPYNREAVHRRIAWPSSPDLRPTTLPMRQVKIPKSLPAARETRRVQESSPHKYEDMRYRAKYKERIREPSPFGDSEEDSGPPSEPDIHVTPKATRNSHVQSWRPVESPAARQVETQTRSESKKRNRASPDYDDMMLSSMTFAQLQKEPFDTDPAKLMPQSGQGVNCDALSLRLEHNRQRPESEQASFFTSMPIDDWEASGDWFVDQFADLMKQMRAARTRKRLVIQQFEDEAAAREQAVRARSEAIDRKLLTMAQNGRRVIGDKGI